MKISSKIQHLFLPLLHCFTIHILFKMKERFQNNGLFFLHSKKDKYPHIVVQLQRLSFKTFAIM